MNKIRDTYKFKVKRGNKIIAVDCTSDLRRRGSEYKARFPDATIEKVGIKTTREAALAWLKKCHQL